MSKAFVKEDDGLVEDAADVLPERPPQPLPITQAGFDRLSAELAELAKESRRARVLAQVLETVQVTTEARIGDGVGFGCSVTVSDEEGVEATYHIVGPDEVSGDGSVSVFAPLARALLGKNEGDEVEIRLPRGVRAVSIVKITCP